MARSGAVSRAPGGPRRAPQPHFQLPPGLQRLASRLDKALRDVFGRVSSWVTARQNNGEVSSRSGARQSGQSDPRSTAIETFRALVVATRRQADTLTESRKVRVAAIVGAALVVVAMALTYAAIAHRHPTWLPLARGQPASPTSQPTPFVVVHTTFGTPTPTILRPAYVVGAWVSDSAPLPTGSVRLYVRVSDYAQLAPASGIPVALQVQFMCAAAGRFVSYGPLATDANGFAAFDIAFNGLPTGQPVCVTAFATAGGQTYTATATFAAGSVVPPTPTPTLGLVP